MTGLYVASNVAALGAQHALTRSMGSLSDVLTRLSTGLRINSGKDDPAGLIASEMLKAQITGTNAAITNTQRANGMISTADAALGQVSTLLNDIKGLVVESANTGPMNADQIAANQLMVDASIDAIDRISKTTTYNGKKLLDGSLGFQTSSLNGTGISNLVINSANMGSASSMDINVRVQEQAKAGTLMYYGTGVSQPTVIDIGGSIGSKTFQFGSDCGEVTVAEMANAINSFSDTTGVMAFVDGQASRGQITLSSAGANNEIVITANEVGLENGNYTFRIVQGLSNDARIVSDPSGSTPGVVEIQLVGSQETAFNNFAGLFNITIDAEYAGTSGTAGPTSVNMTRGDANKVIFFTDDTDAEGVSKTSGVTMTVDSGLFDYASDDVTVSMFNGWTVKVDTAKANTSGTGDYAIDHDNKTLYVDATAAGASDLETAFEAVFGASSGTLTGAITLSGALLEGDSITLGNGGNAGELFIQYKAGATAGEIQALINNAPNVQATLKSGVSASDTIPALPKGYTYQAKLATDATVNPWVSSATAQTVIDLVNSKLGDKFTATGLNGQGTGGRVSYMDGSAVYGDINLDNAIRFSGMDNGPVIRLSTTNSDGSLAINQQLGVRILQPSEADIRAGITTPILEIQLATDGAGNTITTAKDIVALFNKLTAAETLGVSASLVTPTDPNGRIWVTDICGNETLFENCPPTFGNGLVGPTGVPGPCGTQQYDIALLGNNQKLVDDYAFARIGNDAAPYTAVTGAAGTQLTFGATSALNGMSFAFTADERKEGFNADTGILTVFLGSSVGSTAADVSAAVNSAVAANWEGIRAFTGSTLLTPGTLEQITSSLTKTAALALTGSAGILTVGTDVSKSGGTPGTAGVAVQDPALTITAKDLGTGMAGVNIFFVQDDSMTAWSGGTATMELGVQFNELENGEKQLVIKGNMGTATSVTNAELVASLNANTDFSKLFDAAAIGPTTGAVAFKAVNSNAHAVTEGGYRVESNPDKTSKPMATSSGLVMIGASDSNERLVLQATEVGSSNFVRVNVIEGSFRTFCPLGYEMSYLAGTDMCATVNGIKASADGNNISVNTSDLSMSMTVNPGVYMSPTGTGFSINGGGAVVQLGPEVVSGQQIRIGIGAVDSAHLGGTSGLLYMLKSGNAADMFTNTKLADRIVTDAISAVANQRGRLGALQKATLDPNIASLETSLEQLVSSEAMISNADFATESAKMMQAQILVQAGMRTLAVANQFTQYAAQLIG